MVISYTLVYTQGASINTWALSFKHLGFHINKDDNIYKSKALKQQERTLTLVECQN